MFGMAPPRGDNSRHLQKLAALVTQRRVALGYGSKEAAATACGISHMTYRKVEGTKGTPPMRVEDATYAKIDAAYGFLANSCKAVADGAADSITLTDGTELIEGGQIRTVDPEILRAGAKDAVTQSALLVTPELTGAKIRALSDEVVEEMRRRGLVP